MDCDRHREVRADSAFANEDSKGYALKGVKVMRRDTDRRSNDQVWHLLEGSAHSHKNVVRSTFGAKLFAVTGAADDLIPMPVTLQSFASDLNLRERPSDFAEKVAGVSEVSHH